MPRPFFEGMSAPIFACGVTGRSRALAYTIMQVSEIAYMLGYSDPAYFARVFAQAAGESPSAFRARTTAL